STTIGVISGLISLTAGRIEFAGRDITRVPAHRRFACGLARTFQNSRLFGRLSVRDNLSIATRQARTRPGFLERRRATREAVAEALELAGLSSRANDLAADLSSTERRRLEWARALAAKPRFLLLDEPGAGMTAEERQELRTRILDSRGQGLTVLLVDHVMDLVMAVSDRIAGLNFGRKIAEGTPTEMCASAAVR